MRLKRALQITIALRDEVKDARLKQSLSYVLNNEIDRALDVWANDFSSIDSFPNFFFVEMVHTNLKKDYEYHKIYENIPMCMKVNIKTKDPKNALEMYQLYFKKISEGIIKPETSIEKYICSLVGYEWKTNVDKEIINFYYKIRKKFDFCELSYQDNSEVEKKMQEEL